MSEMAFKALNQEPCEDAVSRQAVLEQTYNWSKDEFLRVTNPFHYLRKRINSLPSVNPQEPKWIPVSERLPEDKYAVLVWCPERKNIYCAYREENQWWIFGAFVQIVPNEVVAWMPLPQPYESQERSEDR